jgi:hypothetical protein
VRGAYAGLEPAAPRLAVRLLESYVGEGVLVDDVVTLDLARDAAWLRLPQPARHLSEPTVEEGIACRWVRDRETRLFLASSWDAHGDVVIDVRARALETLEPQAMEALWDENTVGRLDMEPAWRDYRFRVPARLVHTGTNVLVLRFQRAPSFRRTRGEGPHEVRPAALSALGLHRLQE